MIVASPPTLDEGEYGAGNEQQQPEPRKRSIGGIIAIFSVPRKIPGAMGETDDAQPSPFRA